VDDLRVTCNFYEIVFKRLDGAVEAELKVKGGRRHYLRVETGEKSWLLADRDEFSRVVGELGLEEMVSAAFAWSSVCTIFIDASPCD